MAHASTVAALTQALEAAGVEFIDENGGGPAVRLRRHPDLLQQLCRWHCLLKSYKHVLDVATDA
jgi:hypothetical protein